MRYFLIILFVLPFTILAQTKHLVKPKETLYSVAKKYNIMLINDDEHSDYCLIPWNNMLKDPINKIAYKQYGAFYKHAIQHKVAEPKKSLYNDFYSKNKHFTLFCFNFLLNISLNFGLVCINFCCFCKIIV